MLDQPDDSVDPRQWLLRMAGQTPMTAGAPPITPGVQGVQGVQQGVQASMAGQGQQRPAMVAPPIGGTPTQTDQAQLAQLKEQGSGVSRLQANHPFVGGIARVGDVLGSIFAPHATAMIPGTTLNHERQLGQQQQMVNQDLAGEKEQAQVADLNAKPELAQAKNELATEKMHSAEQMGHENMALKQQHEDALAQQKSAALNAQLREHGFKQDETGALKPLDYGEMSPQQQAVSDLQAAREEQAKATADFHKAQTSNMPMQMHLAQARIANAQQNSSIAERRLALSQKQFELGAYGTVGGEQPAGGLQTDQGTPVGTKFQANVKPTTNARNASERAQTMTDLEQRIRQGIGDPEIRKYLGPMAGRVAGAEGAIGMLPEKVAQFRNDLKSYGAFQAGLHPIRGIGGLEYFDKVMGGMGQTPEQLLGKLDSNRITAQSVQGVGHGRINEGAAKPAAAKQGAAAGDLKSKSNEELLKMLAQ